MLIYPYETAPIEYNEGEIIDDITEILDVEQDRNYLNLPASFDIETSRFHLGGKEYLSTMYIWQISLGGIVFTGRTWNTFRTFLQKVSEAFELSDKRRLILYVHNLSFEFSFIKNQLNFVDNVFADSPREIFYCYCPDYSIEFRCSLKLSGGYSLENVSKKLIKKYPVEKLVGFLDYELYRSSTTPLTSNELAYCINDVLVVTSYIQEKIEQDGGISRIPLTNTGYVRKYISNSVFSQEPIYYRLLMKSLTVEEKEYSMLKAAFQGGFVHANAFYSSELLTDVASYDFKSSYPAEMVLNDRFPMEKVEYHEVILSLSELERLCNKYCCLFEIYLKDLQATELYETPLAGANGKVKISGAKLNNGKVVYAKEYIAVITDVDYEIIKKYYTFSELKVTQMYCYRADRLPTPFVEAILYLYEQKTTLDGIPEKAVEYMVSKNMLNASFGAAVTDIVRATLLYTDGGFKKEMEPVANQLANYNKKYYRFLSYAWGVWITAHSRYKLLNFIEQVGMDYIYCDTDSIKLLNRTDYDEIFTNYNNEIFTKQLISAGYHEININKFRPKNPKGVTKSIGTFEYEGEYSLFKAIRAKTYCYEKDNFFNITISGLNKKKAVPYLISKVYQDIDKSLLSKAYNDDKEAIKQLKQMKLDYIPVFNLIKDGLYIPANYTGRLISSYKDEPYVICNADYQGKFSIQKEKSGVSLIPSDYNMSLTADFLNYIEGIRGKYGQAEF